MKSPICYPGAKIKLASWIVDHMPPQHSVYVEPFSGSAAVFFNKQPVECEVLNDTNGDIVRFLRTVRDRPDELREFLEQTPYSRRYFRGVKEKWFVDGDRPDDPVRRAGEYFALMEQGYTADLEPSSFSRPSVHPNTWKVETWHNKIDERIDVAAERLLDVCIEELDYAECIDAYDCDDAVIYCDPPYYQRSTDYGAEDFSHEKLATAVRTADSKVIISYDDLPPTFVKLVNEDDWVVVERDAVRTVINYRETSETKERLVMNYDPSDAATSAATSMTNETADD